MKRGTLRKAATGRVAEAGARLSASQFLTRLKGGRVGHAHLAELQGGLIVVDQPAAGQAAEVLARLVGELERQAGRAGARTVVRPLLRLGPADLWRPHVGLVAERSALALDHPGATLEPANALLIVLLAPKEAAAERVARYAAAGVRELWCVSLCWGFTVRYGSPWAGRFRSRTLWYPGEALPVAALASARVEALEAGFRPAERRAGGPDCGGPG